MNKDFILGAVLATIVAAAMFAVTPANTSVTPHNLNVWTSAVEAEVIRTNGLVEKQYMGPNNITNTGLNWVRDMISNTNASGRAVYIYLGNGSTAEDVTLLNLPNQINNTGNCGLYPPSLTYSIVGTGNYSTTQLWTVSGCTGGNIVVNTTALFNHSAATTTCTGTTGCTMFAGKNFSAPVTLQNGDQLNITWYVWAASGG